jgi:hypothetical protein
LRRGDEAGLLGWIVPEPALSQWRLKRKRTAAAKKYLTVQQLEPAGSRRIFSDYDIEFSLLGSSPRFPRGV